MRVRTFEMSAVAHAHYKVHKRLLFDGKGYIAPTPRNQPGSSHKMNCCPNRCAEKERETVRANLLSSFLTQYERRIPRCMSIKLRWCQVTVSISSSGCRLHKQTKESALKSLLHGHKARREQMRAGECFLWTLNGLVSGPVYRGLQGPKGTLHPRKVRVEKKPCRVQKNKKHFVGFLFFHESHFGCSAGL